MSLHKGIDKYTGPALRDLTTPSTPTNPWWAAWPNPADFNFNYWNLLHSASNSSIARMPLAKPPKIAIVGAGVAGLTAARELFRSGYIFIDIYEASERIAGRNYSIPAGNGSNTSFEMGAMRMPFFPPGGTGSGTQTQNSVIDYYATLFGITTQPFPDPGSAAVATGTGIYINDGFGPSQQSPYAQPQMDIWQPGQAPPNPAYQDIYAKWSSFATMVQATCQPIYNQGPEAWSSFWQSIVNNYWTMNFRDLVFLPAISQYDPQRPGYFGGLGMNEQESQLFYVIGAGDGGWGAFYDISCLYPIRTLLFGFGTQHQLAQGTFSGSQFAPGPQQGQAWTDHAGHQVAGPSYLGVQAFSECLFYEPVVSGLPLINGTSLFTATQSSAWLGMHIYTQTPVTQLSPDAGGGVDLTSAQGTVHYDAVIVTAPTWAVQMSINMEKWTQQPSLLPWEAAYSIRESHWITSAKIFYPLKQRYWEVSKIPQVMSTDTFLQDVYGYAVDVSPSDPGVLLVSYTWEDDANKLLPGTLSTGAQAAMAQQALAELDHVLSRCSNIGTTISQYVDTTRPVTIQWAELPTYRGCAKLYRERSWSEDYALLTYNQQYSKLSGLYFAGEAYSVEGGWTEPAFRLALDAVINLVNNTGGVFLNGFSMSDYPTYNTGFQPTSTSDAAEAPGPGPSRTAAGG